MGKRYTVEQKPHAYSRMVIDFCIKHGEATLLWVYQQQKNEIEKEDAFF